MTVRSRLRRLLGTLGVSKGDLWRLVWRARRTIAAATPSGGPAVHVYLDEPRDTITSSSVHLKGWVAARNGVDLVAEANDRPLPLHFYERPDVTRAFAGHWARGFSTFVRLSELEDRASLSVRISGAGRTLFERRFGVHQDAQSAAAAESDVRARHRAWLTGRMVCIRCAAPLDADLRCTGCGHEYAVDGLLNCLPEGMAATTEIEFTGAVCSHGYDADVERVLRGVEAEGGMALDCGAGWRHVLRPSVITTEIFPYPSTDVLAVSQRLPFADGVFDAVLSLHVLEHVSNPFACAAELLRVLKPGGTLFAVTPMIAPEHGFPHHYFNPTREGLSQLFGRHAAGARVFVPHMGHPINGVHSVLGVYAETLPADVKERFLKLTIGDILAKSIEEWLPEEIATAMSDEGRARLAANFCIELTRKPN